MKIHIHLKEFETSAPVELTEDQLNALYSYEFALQILGTNKVGHYRLRANSHVGTLLVPRLAVHIQPKMGAVDTFKMLLEGDDQSPQYDAPSIMLASESIWDLIAKSLLKEIDYLKNQGFEKAYITRSENLSQPHGQIDFGQDLLANMPVRSGIFCHHDTLSPNTKRNQALKWSIDTLTHLVSNEMHEYLISAQNVLIDVDMPSTPPDLELPPSADPYRHCIYLFMLIKKYENLSIGMSGIASAGYLLNMNVVFEGFVRNRLRRNIRASNLHIMDKRTFTKELCSSVNVIPDIVVRDKNGVPILIADCKYKIDWKNNSSDIYQMLAYLEAYNGILNGIIFYPTFNNNLKQDVLELPTRKRLHAIGIPTYSLFVEDTWRRICVYIDSTIIKVKNPAQIL